MSKFSRALWERHQHGYIMIAVFLLLLSFALLQNRGWVGRSLYLGASAGRSRVAVPAAPLAGKETQEQMVGEAASSNFQGLHRTCGGDSRGVD